MACEFADNLITCYASVILRYILKLILSITYYKNFHYKLMLVFSHYLRVDIFTNTPTNLVRGSWRTTGIWVWLFSYYWYYVLFFSRKLIGFSSLIVFCFIFIFRLVAHLRVRLVSKTRCCDEYRVYWVTVTIMLCGNALTSSIWFTHALYEKEWIIHFTCILIYICVYTYCIYIYYL